MYNGVVNDDGDDSNEVDDGFLEEVNVIKYVTTAGRKEA